MSPVVESGTTGVVFCFTLLRGHLGARTGGVCCLALVSFDWFIRLLVAFAPAILHASHGWKFGGEDAIGSFFSSGFSFTRPLAGALSCGEKRAY